MDLAPGFDEFIASLTAHGVEFLMQQMGVEPVQIHVMSAIGGVDCDDAWATRAIDALTSGEA